MLAGDPPVLDMIYLLKYFHDFTNFIYQDRKIPAQSFSNTTWEGDYEHLLDVSVDVLEEQEGVTLNGDEEGDEEIEYEGQEDDLEAEIGLDDDFQVEIDY